MKKLSILLLILSLTQLSACSWLGWDDDDKQAEDETAGYTERDFYEKIQKNLNAHNWTVAIQNLRLLESHFPFGKYAEQSQLELIYALHRSGDHEAAIASADRFIRLHPQHPNVDYAYYIKGLAEMGQSSSIFDSFLPTDGTQRDPGTARNAFATLSELLSRFPESPYAPDARKRLVNLRNWLARGEIHAANYYFKRKAYVAAANRGRYVVENYQQTPAVADGLAVMAQAYHLLGMDELANRSASILSINYPDYPALDKNGDFDYSKRLSGDDDSLLSTVTFGLLSSVEPPAYDTRMQYNASFRDAEKVQQPDEESEERSIWSWLTFGLLD